MKLKNLTHQFKFFVPLFIASVLGASKCDQYQLDEDWEEIIAELLDCDPGESQPCFCQDGGQGFQICTTEGGGWDLCICDPKCVPTQEICDNKDNDCDGQTDEGALHMPTWYADQDGDSFGDASHVWRSCRAPAGFVADNTDCNDDQDGVHPGHPETCDNLDNDCNPETIDGIDDCLYGCDGNSQNCIEAQACEDDPFEPNDSWLTASSLVADGTVYQLTLCPENTAAEYGQHQKDWFLVSNVAEGTTISVSLRCVWCKEHSREADLFLYALEGEGHPVTSSYNGVTSETMQWEVSSGQSGDYYIEVSDFWGLKEVGLEYELSISFH